MEEIKVYQVHVYSHIRGVRTINLEKHFLTREEAVSFYRDQLIKFAHLTFDDEDEDNELRMSITTIKHVNHENVQIGV